MLYEAFFLLIFVTAVMSWFPALRRMPFGDTIHAAGEALLAPFRRMLQRMGMGGGGIDFSPVAAYIVVYILYIVLRSLCIRMGIN
jgi:uncharacterized protein YggT (Ycf19 family)